MLIWGTIWREDKPRIKEVQRQTCMLFPLTAVPDSHWLLLLTKGLSWIMFRKEDEEAENVWVILKKTWVKSLMTGAHTNLLLALQQLFITALSNKKIIFLCYVFLTVVERSLERADFTGCSWNPVDSHLVHASPLHFLHAASHHMRNQHSLLSDRGLRV